MCSCAFTGWAAVGEGGACCCCCVLVICILIRSQKKGYSIFRSSATTYTRRSMSSTYLVDAAELQEIVLAHQMRVMAAVCASTTVVLLIAVGFLLWLRSTVVPSNRVPALWKSRPSGLLDLAPVLPKSLEEAAGMVGLCTNELASNGIVDFDTLMALPAPAVAFSMCTPEACRRALYLSELGKRVQATE